jgi:hypothetical protein
VRIALATIALATLAACGPIQSTAALIDADVEIEAARAAGAAQSSTYEFAGAEANYSKAKELAGYARYEASSRFARNALMLAKAARKNAIASSNRPQETP